MVASKEYYTFDNFVKENKELVGKEVSLNENFEGSTGEASADLQRIRDFTWALGDDNPLFTDPAYAARTRYGCVIAPPTFPIVARYPGAHGKLWEGPWPASTLFSGDELECFDVIRVKDKIRSDLKYKDVFEKQGKRGRLLFFVTEGHFWNQHNELVGKQYGTQILVGMKTFEGMTQGKEILYERGLHKYSPEEVERILSDIKAEARRGSETLYWEDVNVGDKLTPVVKGPMHLGDMIAYYCGAVPMVRSFKLNLRDTLTHLGAQRLNPITNWPYDNVQWEHNDFNLCKMRGLPGPFDLGIMRVEMASHVLTNWAGDDGFLRRMRIEIRKPNFYGDTTWFKGEVVKKYKVSEGDVEYGAVDLRIDVVNQIGEMTAPGTATVYLPSPGRDVVLPIPHKHVPPPR